MDILFCNITYPAKGNTTSLGIGGNTVSISAARKTPGYKLSEINERTHCIIDSNSLNSLWFRQVVMKFGITFNTVFNVFSMFTLMSFLHFFSTF